VKVMALKSVSKEKNVKLKEKRVFKLTVGLTSAQFG
jgi:hypothetical protein